MNATNAFLRKQSRWNHFRLWVAVSLWPDVRDWFLRWIYAQHNARVLADFEDRMVSVIYEASGGMMSKPYYTKEAMLEQIQRHISDTFDEGYQEGQKDKAEELAA